MNTLPHERYITPYIDYGFKKLFGTEMNKELLISFLNALFMGKETVKDLRYLPNEHFGQYDSRRGIFDVYCENESGDNFIVEMQNTNQKYYKDQSVLYATFPIQEQAKIGQDWDFELKKVYTIGILNFVFDEDKDDKEYLHHVVMLMDTKKKTVFYDKLTFIYLELPKFTKTEDELETMFDKWLFILRHLSEFPERPAVFHEEIFNQLFEQAEIARFTFDERWAYEGSVKAYRDIRNSIITAERNAEKKGMEKGAEKEKRKIAKLMKANGAPIEMIAKCTELSEDEIKKI